VTNLYVASFAAQAGVNLKDESGTIITVADAILTREDTSFMTHIVDICAANAGMMPDRYDEGAVAGTLPRRMLSVGTVCD
jgi:hypothetical protein